MGSDLYYPYLLGGGERRMYEIAIRLARKHEIHMVTRRLEKLPDYELHKGVHIHRVFTRSGSTRLTSITDGCYFMVNSLRKAFELDIFDIYAPQQFFPIPPLWLVSRAKKKPIVVTIHDVYGKTWTQKYGLKGTPMLVFEKLMLKLPYTKIITVSNASRKKLIAEGVPPDRIEVIPNGVSLKEFEGVKVRKPEKPRIIYLGRLVGYKHVEDLLVAFSKLRLDAELYIVGEGEKRTELEKLAKQLGIEGKVTFTGFVDESRKIKLLKSSHLFVLPSTTEGFGISLLEAMASGVPFVASEIEPLLETSGGKGGLFFKPRDCSDLANKISQLLEDQNLQRKCTREGLKRARDFDWEVIAEKTERVFETLGG
jgi:glycosyltransferase involved in cell wall biosynthesis